jgi:hypothetical protein
MKSRFSPAGIFVILLTLILTGVLFSWDFQPRMSICANGDLSDAGVALSRVISIEMVQLLHISRGLTNPEICSMPQDKLERAIYKAENPMPDHPAEAALFRLIQTQDEHGEIPPDAIGKALSQVENMPRVKLVPGGDYFNNSLNLAPIDWTWLGPGNIGGRVRSIVIHPTEPDRMWAGAVSGGIWYSNNAGVSWSPVDDFMINLAVSTLIMHPTDSNILFAGTGEGFYNIDSVRGAGVFKSLDGGLTWTQIPSTATSNWYWVNRLAISPDGSILLAATRSGIWRSTNGGDSWTNVNSDSYVKDIDFHPTDSDEAIAASAFCKAYYSANGGETWSSATGLPTCTADSDWLSRVEVAYVPGNGDIVYASINRNSGEIWSSTTGGQSYSLTSTGYNYLGSQGWYDNIIWVDPTNPNLLVVGGIDLWRSTDAGLTLAKISEWWYAPLSAHADHHAIVTHPNFNGSTNKTVIFGNDGGVYKTDDIYTVKTGILNNGWIELNNQLGITQFYGAAGNNISGVIVGGTQDNGTLRYAGNTEGWTAMYGGDGGFCASDPLDPNYFYGEYVYLMIHRSKNGGLTSSYIYSGITDAGNGSTANFIAPFILDPNNPTTMLAGGVNLWRSTNVNASLPTWAPIKPSIGSNISAIAIASGNSAIIWVGHNDGSVYRTVNGTVSNPTWIRVDTNTPYLPDRYVHRMTIDSQNPEKVYVTFGGFSVDNVYRTTNNGANWVDLTGFGSTGLPDVHVRSLVIHPGDSNKLFVGTEIGIFSSIDGGANWAIPQDGPANVSVDELFWMSQTLVAATHGRGIYLIDLSRTYVYIPLISVEESP